MLLQEVSYSGFTVCTDEFLKLIGKKEVNPPGQSLVEYAARLCYDSTDKFGTAPNFIDKLVMSDHMDVFEHSVFSLTFKFFFGRMEDFYSELFEMQQNNPYIRFCVEDMMGGIYHITVTGSIRSMWDLYYSNYMENNYLYKKMYDHIGGAIDVVNSVNITNNEELYDSYSDLTTIYKHNPYGGCQTLTTTTGAKVTLIGLMAGDVANKDVHEVYLINDVSRAFSHQHVRHRLLSISQMSQRYVDFNKKDDGFVYPNGITDAARAKLDGLFEVITETYRELRTEDSLKKQDARCVLPNATKTHLISSCFSVPGMEHYLRLRTASDAQEEIRLVAKAINTIHEDVLTYQKRISRELSRSR